MRIFRHPGPLPCELARPVIALGNFDGIHLGHHSVIARALELARDAGQPAGVLTFEPHPRSFFHGAGAPFRLTTFRQKCRVLADAGVDLMVNLAFGPKMAALTAQDFVIDILVGGLDIHHVLTGPGFVFGKNRHGNTHILARMAEREGFGYTEVPGFSLGSRGVSSTDIRLFVRRGQVEQAAERLGRLWEFEERVRTGDRRGREMGFPTANLPLEGVLHPAPGIYAVRAGLGHGASTTWHDGAAYIGTRPTFKGTTMVLEVHLFDFSGDLYGQRMRVAFAARVRKDMTFDSADDLARKIADDCDRARAILAT
ncbi:MAG: bifunctional riboflavin kinase/FAD synthetase [bacterium]|nr:bifunctional riboflavin kinase/FAD synthetase [bacterium]